MTVSIKNALVGSAILTAFALSTSSMAGEWGHTALNGKAGEINEIVHASTSSSSAIMFTCASGKLRAAISTQGEEANEILKAYTESRRRINRTVTLKVGDKDPYKSKWIINPSSKIYVTPSRREAAKLYNAVINQQDASIRRDSKDKIDLAFPKADAAFSEFGAGCGVGTNAKNT